MALSPQSASAHALIRGLQEGQWTSVELTEHFLSEISKSNPKVHAVPIVVREAALAQARASDLRRKNGKVLGRFDGLPMTVKDALRIRDLRSTWGLRMFRNYVPKSDSKIAESLRKSGIVFLGRTAIPTAALNYNCRNQVYAECVNPFDSTRTPGGSSGGAAAALAMGMTPLELGSDLGGSIRYPSHCCGVYGLRTTDGLLPIDDIGPEGAGAACRQMVAFGPMARNRADLDLLLELFTENLTLPRAICGSEFGGKLKIAYANDLMGIPLDSQSKPVFESYIAQLRAKGFEVIETKPPLDFDLVYQVWGTIVGFEFTNVLPKFLRTGLGKSFAAWWILDRRVGRGPLSDHFKRGLHASQTEYEKVCAQRAEIYRVLERFFSEYSVWILPTAPSAAFPLKLSGKEFITENGTFSYTQYVGPYIVPTTVLGTPVLSLPIGKDRNGMPIGAQIFGPRFADRWLIDVGAKLEATRV